MTLDKIQALGATVCAGQIDLNGVNIGFLSADGPVLTPEGEEALKELVYDPLDAPAPRARSRRKAKATDVVDVEDAEVLGDPTPDEE